MKSLQESVEETNLILNKILVVCNAYFNAALNDEQKKKYIDLIKESGIIISEDNITTDNKPS